MKRLLCVSFFLALTAVLTGCGESTGKADNASTPTTQKVTEEADTTAEPGTYEPLATVRERDIVSNEIYDYEIYDGGVIITKYKGSDTEVTIPDEIDGSPVTEIGFYAFEAMGVSSVTLPETVRVIGEGAFIDCTALVSINLPSGLTTVERGAFAGCTAIPELTVPAGVKEIKRGAFAGCTSLTSLELLSADLSYDEWGIEDLPDLKIYAPEGSAAAGWAGAMGKLSVN
ncbi:MAG: leucine-rich repeat domain-containing protein [Ruminococcus sp.]|uniref:leucine-rich repeat domain-containing protein n=1 Tax=Ruminococcus sp. TaxID=41978 RepID=UPI001B0A6B2B|nr:leucine-rich repeat domain-containing protein [Ruminococcus sp.]MBO7473381.1 leucine-rich repeat domain-containing protein [Ruminococcus sp.]